MYRENLLKLLNRYTSLYPEEIEHKDKIISFIKENSDCFNRSLEIGHITASAWLVNEKNDAVLLMHHAKLNKWLQFGGHADGNPDVKAVAIKETIEESGIEESNISFVMDDIFDLDIHTIPQTNNEKEHLHYDIRFLLKVTKEVEPVGNMESKEIRWFKKDCSNLPTKETSMIRMFDKWVKI